MQHAAEISAGDSSDSKVERAIRQRDLYFMQQKFLENSSAGEQLSNTIKFGYDYGMDVATALKPGNFSKSVKAATSKLR